MTSWYSLSAISSSENSIKMIKELVVAKDLSRTHISNLIQALLLCSDNLPSPVVVTWISILEFNFNSGLNCNCAPLHNIKSC